MGGLLKHPVALICLALASLAQAQPVPRRPRGVYAVVSIEGDINQQQKANPTITAAQLNAYFNGLYQNLLNNPAISGLTLQVHWDTVNPNPPGAANAYDWSLVDDAFAQASAWNAQNPTSAAKTIQLIVTPGFQTPQWVINQIPSCDGLFQTPGTTPPGKCGTVTFTGYQESGDGAELPLPWNPVYKSAWRTFLTALAGRYGSNPAFVSIAVAGPTAASAEMTTASNSTATNPQPQFGAPIAPNDMWRQLFAFHYPGMAAYQNSDQAFIDEWDAAIDLYGQVFSGVTLVATTGSGLPNLSQNFTLPAGFAAECASPNMQCAAVAAILSYFSGQPAGGANAKATQTSGMVASHVGNPNLGIGGVKILSKSTAQLPSPSTQVLGGAQFDTTFSGSTLEEGCTSDFPPNANEAPAGCAIPSSCNSDGCVPVACIPQACLAPGVTPASLASFGTFSKVPSSDLIPNEQAEYNVLNFYFDGTPVASFFGGTNGTAPLNYLQVYAPDIQYAEANANAPAQVVLTNGVTVTISAQDLLNLASQKLLSIAEPALLPSITPGGILPAFGSPGTIQPGEWVSIYGTNLAAGIANWTGTFPISLGGSSVTIDGKSAYLSYVSPGLINVQAPSDATAGKVTVAVTTTTGTATSTVTLAPFSPAFFLLDSRHVAGIILRPKGGGAYAGGSYDIIGPTGTSLGYPTVAAKAGDTIALFGTGFGPTNPAIPAGQPFSGAAATTSPVTLLINNVGVNPGFAGLSGAGVYQINLTIPSGLGTGDVALNAAVSGVQTPAAVVSLQ